MTCHSYTHKTHRIRYRFHRHRWSQWRDYPLYLDFERSRIGRTERASKMPPPSATSGPERIKNLKSPLPALPRISVAATSIPARRAMALPDALQAFDAARVGRATGEINHLSASIHL